MCHTGHMLSIPPKSMEMQLFRVLHKTWLHSTTPLPICLIHRLLVPGSSWCYNLVLLSLALPSSHVISSPHSQWSLNETSWIVVHCLLLQPYKSKTLYQGYLIKIQGSPATSSFGWGPNHVCDMEDCICGFFLICMSHGFVSVLRTLW